MGKVSVHPALASCPGLQPTWFWQQKGMCWCNGAKNKYGACVWKSGAEVVGSGGRGKTMRSVLGGHFITFPADHSTVGAFFAHQLH